jgi:multidrug efflux pump subunit AcrB
VAGGTHAIYDTPNYRRLRSVIRAAVRHKFLVSIAVLVAFGVSILGMSLVPQQFFPKADRPEVLIEVRLPEGSSIETTSKTVERLEAWLQQQPETELVSSYIGQGAPRFYLAMSPEMPDPAYAKIVVLTKNAETREELKYRMREAVADGLAPEAFVRVTQLIFGPQSPFPIEFRISGPDPEKLIAISDEALKVMRSVPDVREANRDWGNKSPSIRFVLNQDRLKLIGLSPTEAAQQLQFLLSGIPVTQLREDIRTVDIIARSAGNERLDPTRLRDFALTTRDGKLIPLDQIGSTEVRMEEPILKRRDRTPTVTIRSDLSETAQPPKVSTAVLAALQPLINSLPAGYHVEMGGSIDEAAKANAALSKVFPLMITLTLLVIMLQVRSFSATIMVVLTAPLGIVGAVPLLIAFEQPFGFTAIIGMIGLAGILMRNTLILIEQIKDNKLAGLSDYDAVIEATVQRTRPVILTALAAVLAFIPLTHSVFWGAMAYTLIGGTAGGTILILLFLPALYAVWYRVKPDTSSPASEAGDGGEVTTAIATPAE